MINTLYKPKGSRIWRWKYRLRPKDGRISDISLGTPDKQVAEQIRARKLQELEHERAGIIPSKATRDAAQRNLKDHLREMIGDLRAKGRNAQYVTEFENRFLLLMQECRWECPRDITADSFVAWRSRQSKSPKTLNE